MVHWMIINSQGWHDLSLVARCAYVEIYRRHNGENNGQIAMSSGDLAKRLHCSTGHTARAIRELEAAGFVTIMKVGTFARKDRLASEFA